MKIFLGFITTLLIGFSMGYVFHSPSPHQPVVFQETLPVNPALTYSAKTGQIPNVHEPGTIPLDNGYISKIEATILFAKSATTQQLKDRITSEFLSLQRRPNQAGTDILNIYIEQLLEIDPRNTIGFLLSDNDIAGRFYYRAFCSWVNRDTTSAVDYFLSMEESRWKRSAGECILRIPNIESFTRIEEVIAAVGPTSRELIEVTKLRELPPSEAFFRALTLTGSTRMSALHQIIPRWAKQDINAALTAISSLKNKQEMSNLASAALNGMAVDDPGRAITFARSYFPDTTDIISHIFRGIAHNLPFAQSIEIADSYAEETGDYALLHSMFLNLAEKDTPQALAYVSTIPRKHQDTLYMAIGMMLVHRSPQQALDLALKLDATAVSTKSMVINQFAKQFPDQLEAQLISVSDALNRRMIIQELTSIKAFQDPEATLDWLESYSDEAGYQRNIRGTVDIWIRKDPTAASIYIKDNYDLNEPSNEISYLVKQWMQADAAEATLWVSKLPSGSIAQQQGITEIAIATTYEDPVGAFNLVKDLADQSLKNNAIMIIARIWANKEPDRIDYIAEVLRLGPKTTETLRSNYRGKR